ncbi:hypothetical protein [Actinocorallia longicatena]|uniref:Uncharacterized protein n=1 Tax=Actinocorallia longicatena TaxID=111803 RepID=A0ABP6QK24_9ACTN
MKSLDLPEVRRVHTEHGFHFEPPCPDSEPESVRLAWHAAVVAHETGLSIRLYDEAMRPEQPSPGYYSMAVGSSGMSPMTFSRAWNFLSGVEVGAQHATAVVDVLAQFRDYLDRDFRQWCSPYAIAAQYATSLIKQLDQIIARTPPLDQQMRDAATLDLVRKVLRRRAFVTGRGAIRAVAVADIEAALDQFQRDGGRG